MHTLHVPPSHPSCIIKAASAITGTQVRRHNARSDKLHTRSGDTARSKVNDGQPLQPRGLLEEMERRLQVLRVGVQLFLAHDACLADLAHDSALVADCLDDVACAGLALSADEGGALGDTAQGLAEVACTADERHLERVLVDVVLLVSRRKHLGLVDVVDTDRLQYLRPLSAYRANGWAHNYFEKLTWASTK